MVEPQWGQPGAHRLGCRSRLDPQDRRRDIVRKTRNGLESAARAGPKGGRPRVVDADKRRAILARRAQDQSLREIARGVEVNLDVVHSEVKAAENDPEPQ